MEYSNVTIQGEMNDIIVSSNFFYSCMLFYYCTKWLSSNPQVVNLKAFKRELDKIFFWYRFAIQCG